MLHMLKYAIISHFTKYGYSIPQNKYWLTLQVGKMQSFETHWKWLQIGKMGRSRIARLRFIHPLILLIGFGKIWQLKQWKGWNGTMEFPMYTHSGICNYLWFYTWLLRQVMADVATCISIQSSYFCTETNWTGACSKYCKTNKQTNRSCANWLCLPQELLWNTPSHDSSLTFIQADHLFSPRFLSNPDKG